MMLSETMIQYLQAAVRNTPFGRIVITLNRELRFIDIEVNQRQRFEKEYVHYTGTVPMAGNDRIDMEEK